MRQLALIAVKFVVSALLLYFATRRIDFECTDVTAKVVEAGNPRVIITERGTSFGYHNLIVDMRAFPIIRGFGVPVVYDITHSMQKPGGEGKQTGGTPQFARPLARAERF